MAIKLADTARPNNYVDAEHLGTYPVAYAEDVWFTDGTRLSEKTFDGGSLQKDELPLASADELGKIYQFVGTTGTYINGYFYECVEESSTYTWMEKPVQSTEGLLHEASTLPTASSTNVDERFLYIGADTAELNHGGIYECQETDTDVYEWVLISSASVDLTGYKKVFTDTSTAWSQLTTTEKTEYDFTAFSDEEETGVTEQYSTTETKTNKVWIDGKPIYRKVVEKNATLAGNSWNNTGVDIPEIDTLCNCAMLNVGFAFGGFYTKKISNKLHVYCVSDANWGVSTFILEYTKTTDG